MRIESPRRHERFGAVRIHHTVQVVELDSGPSSEPTLHTVLVPERDLRTVLDGMTIVVPTRDERRKVLAGVLSGIPYGPRIAIVSASARAPVDRYAMELEIVSEYCAMTGRRAVMVHQDDPELAEAIRLAGLDDMLSDGRVRRGKGEAMIIGMLLAEVADSVSVGFVDADNYVPGAVHEYVKSFAVGLAIAPTPYAMVRISWQSKPKIEAGRLVFNRWGRTTQITNRLLNLVLSVVNGFGTDVITTGNAGEHAMTMDLARLMRFAGGFAVEPFEMVELFEQFGGAIEPAHRDVCGSAVDVFQIETRNPHFHEDKGTSHVDGMRDEALAAIAGSPLCPPQAREEIADIVDGATLPDAVVHRPWGDADLARFGDHLSKVSTHHRIS